MITRPIFVANLSAALMVLATVGLAVNRRVRLCRSFFVFLLVLIAGNQLATQLPDIFLTSWFWIVKRTVYTSIAALMALEIALLTFSGLPLARRRALLAMLLVLSVSLWVFLLPTTEMDTPFLAALGIVAPRADAMALWLFLVVMGVAAWSRAPLHPFHRSLLVAFALYLGIETWLLGAVGLAAASQPAYLAAYAVLETLDPLAYSLLAGFWCWAAWRREPGTLLSPPVANRLQPWAAA